ncbi:histidine kinase [Streptomyces chartreusis]|uniref:histidine kinase n=1 Tax=Streptomyces chartreusis TaxID=1969 RepID=UPI0035DB806E
MAVRMVLWSVVLSGAVSVAFAIWVMTLPHGLPQPEGGDGGEIALGVALLSWSGTGAALASLRPRNALGWLFLALGAVGAWQVGLAAYGGYGVSVAGADWPGAAQAVAVASGAHYLIVFSLPTIVLALYPAGRLERRWLRWPVTAAATAIALLTLAAALDREAYDDIVPGGTPPVALTPFVTGVVNGACLVVIGLCSLILTGHTLARLVRSPPPVRQQLAWMVCVLVLLLACQFFVGPLLRASLIGLVPVAVAVGVLRYRMLGIEAVMRRGLVYGTLTLVVIAVYLLATVGLGAVWSRGPLPGVLAAGVVAIGLSPARERLQRAVDWWIYGARRDPLRALAGLGDRVADADDHDLLPVALESVRRALRSPAVSVTGPDGSTLAALGAETTPGLALQLRVAGQALGTMTIAERTPGEPFGSDDRRLLTALAHQVAVVVRARQLTDDVASERDRVVEATRTERDRLRRELHDGLGPSLAGIGLGLQAAADGISRGETGTAAQLVDRTREEVVGAVAEIRRIIDGLRPTALDRFGLAEAVVRHARTLAPTLIVDVRACELPPLPPDVEGAAYRIIGEALTNVARHSGAGTARIALSVDERALHVSVADDGRGIPPHTPSGVGLASMYRRAWALGGSLDVAPAARGTLVSASLPLEPHR